IGLERRPIGHGEDTIVALSLAAARLLDFENADRPAFQDYAGIVPGVVNDEHVERIAIRSLSRGNEAPVEGIAHAGHQWLGEREDAEFGIEIEFAGAAAGSFDHREDMLVVSPGGKLEQ